MDDLKTRYENGSFTALTTAEIVEFFDIEHTPANFIYVLNSLDGFIKRTQYLDERANIDPWRSRRDAIWKKFPSYHQQYDQSQRTPPPRE